MPFKVLTLTAEAEAGDILGRPLGASLDEERLPLSRREELKHSDPTIWHALYQQKNVSYGGAYFAKENLHFYKSVDPEMLNRYLLVDPATSKKKTSDYTTIFVFGVGEDRNFYWLHMLRDRLDLDERTLAVIRLHRRFKPLLVGYEEYGMQSDIAHLEGLMEKLHYRFPVLSLGLKGPHRTLSKQDRIRTLVPFFNAGRVWLPESQVVTLADGRQEDIVPIFIEKEYVKYPGVQHDDMLDVMSRMADPTMDVQFPVNQEDYAPSSLGATGRTWMSG